ncbi:kinesin-like protein KIF20A [Dendronephthya gigantea]|uniref:kinesin-like protein KIF20A n=1 Tax=Dendronephthya gigantea TaxID=151771 RepID=UPI00106D6049|nr:kinesin-like protein KIF20A [Dendronephthya gigantea]XP_028412662.1 kinesin-like protein KIF20A [Dendronephthya gigantea]
MSTNSDSREPIKVYLRIRPLTREEIQVGEFQHCLEVENDRTVVLHAPETSLTYKQSRNGAKSEAIQRFTFSRVFGPETSQKQFYEGTVLDVVKDVVSGHNNLVFSYGITNAGKTYTILGNPKNVGVLPRTFKILFESFKNRTYERYNFKPKMFDDVVKLRGSQEKDETKKKNHLLSSEIPTLPESLSTCDLSSQDGVQDDQDQEDIIIDASSLIAENVGTEDEGPIQFSVWVSFAEIYNEYIFDLLEPFSTKKEPKRRTALKIGDDKNGNPYIKGLTEVQVNDAEEAYKLLNIGRKKQKIASNKLNHTSSRSHCIFTLKILRVVSCQDPYVARVSRLSFVDLAGAERYTKTQNNGERLKEAGNINTSIMTLGKCVELLRYNQNHVNNQKNIPFRESKLTRLLQGFFSGRGKASMIVNVNECASAFDETLHALKFSAIAKKVTTVANTPQLRPRIHTRLLRTPLRSTRVPLTPAVDNSSPALSGALNFTEADSNIDIISLEENQELHEENAMLKKILMAERKEKIVMEMRIRDEVGQEMAEQIAEIERNYEERMEEEQTATVELYEKRLEILSQSIKKGRKRASIECFEDEDFYQEELVYENESYCRTCGQVITKPRTKTSKKGVFTGSSITSSAKKLKRKMFPSTPSTQRRFSFKGSSAKKRPNEAV